jgi:hypothetical protein
MPAKTRADSKLRKLGHSQIQKGPQRVKRGQYRRRYWPEWAKMAVDQPFPRGTFKVELGPGEHEVSVCAHTEQ